MEIAGGPLGGQIDYYKPELDHRFWLVPFWKPALMIRNKLNYLAAYRRSATVPGAETFRLGGTRTDYLRGYHDYEIVPEVNIHRIDGNLVRFPGGRFAYTFTTEYQFAVVNPVRGLLFLDAGNTWNATRDFSLGDLKMGVGIGTRVEIPMLGLVGLDYAYGIARGRWMAHFIIGPAF
jgi:outer membrane protein insertion porin family